MIAGTLLGAVSGYSGAGATAARSDAPGAARDPLDRLGAAVHPLARHFRDLEGGLIAVGVFFPVYLGVMGAILSVDRKIVEVGRIFRLRGRR